MRDKKQRDLRVGDKVIIFKGRRGKVLDMDYDDQHEPIALVEYLGRGYEAKPQGTVWVYRDEIQLVNW
jgi:deoxycytidine triphosphate deaminase